MRKTKYRKAFLACIGCSICLMMHPQFMKECVSGAAITEEDACIGGENKAEQIMEQEVPRLVEPVDPPNIPQTVEQQKSAKSNTEVDTNQNIKHNTNSNQSTIQRTNQNTDTSQSTNQITKHNTDSNQSTIQSTNQNQVSQNMFHIPSQTKNEPPKMQKDERERNDKHPECIEDDSIKKQASDDTDIEKDAVLKQEPNRMVLILLMLAGFLGMTGMYRKWSIERK